jgi:hypothetical protein
VLIAKEQGCQMVCLVTKNPNSGKFWSALDGKIFLYFVAIWNTLRTFGIFHDHLVNFVFIWDFFVLVSWTKKNLATLQRGTSVALTTRLIGLMAGDSREIEAQTLHM